ncbi:MAG: phosphotransacetylase family protein [Chloroflexia bacterium]|nr:phosphotransacetylase family protein [Chloroflexia bacterium]
METILIISAETFTGKSAVCITIGQRLQRDGYRLGYMKPLCVRLRRAEHETFDEDAAFVKQVFELKEPQEQLTPLCLTPRLLEAMFRGDPQPDYVQLVQEAFQSVSQDKDMMLLEGPNDWSEGTVIGLPAPQVASLFNARLLIVSRFETMLEVDNILALRAAMADRDCLGVVINAVPRARLGLVQRLVRPFLEKQGLPVLAVIPKDPILYAVCVNELVEHLGAEVLCCADYGENLVESMMVGAMSVDSALSYFRRQPNKAVITGGDRVDIQLAALETSTTCLILTGSLRPNPLILTRSEELGVPILLVSTDTMTTVRQVEEIFGRARFRQTSKIARFETLLDSHFDWDRFYKSLDLPQQDEA